MIIQGTKRFLDGLGIKRKWLSHVGRKKYPAGLFDWNADIVVLDSCPCLVLVNNLTGYPVVIRKDETFDTERISEYVIEALRYEGICENVLSYYRNNIGKILLDKTSDRAIVQRLRIVCNEVLRCGDRLECSCLQVKIGQEAARMRVNFSDLGYKAPSEYLLEVLERWKTDCGIEIPLLDLDRLDLLIKLEIPGSQIEVRAEVPANITWGFFHKLIVQMFGWSGKGEHAFFCGKMQMDEINGLSDIEWLDKVIYEYRSEEQCFVHSIHLLRIMRHQHKREAIALERRGDRISYPGEIARKRSLRELNIELKWMMTR